MEHYWKGFYQITISANYWTREQPEKDTEVMLWKADQKLTKEEDWK